MNELINVTVSIYFKVHNSDMFGGKDSVGYTSTCLNGVRKINSDDLDDKFLDIQTESIADIFNVNKSDVHVISQKEYELNNNDEDNNTVAITLRELKIEYGEKYDF